MPSVVLLGYDLEQPSFRHRMLSLVGALEAAGWRVRPERFPSGRYGLRTRERRSLLREADVDSPWRKRKFAATCRWVHVVAAGNDVLAGAARPSARAIELLPTSID